MQLHVLAGRLLPSQNLLLTTYNHCRRPTPQVFQALEEAQSSGRALHHTFSINVAPSTIEWQGIGCSYNTPTGIKEVLADVWGVAQPGEMQALLGPSGAGKST